MKKIVSIFLMAGIGFAASAQEKPTTVKLEKKPGKIGEVYWAMNMDGYLLSSSKFQKPGMSEITTPRFTLFLHAGTTAHYNFSKSFGIFSGLGIKNIGFIEKFSILDSTVIRRNYTVGIPLGIKFGDMFGTYGMIGGGVDIPFLYKEKGFVKRNNKDKFHEWFSQRTATVLPYVFAGARFNPGVFVKAIYYPTNFMNPDYSQNVGVTTVKPYAGYNVNLFMLSVGFDINYRPKYE